MSERTWGIASYGLVAIGAIAAGSYIAWECGIKSADIAAWVQAVGSIAALGGAFGMLHYQRRLDRQDFEVEARAARAQLATVIENLAQEAWWEVQSLAGACATHRANEYFSYPAEKLESVQFGLRTVVSPMGDATLVALTIDLLREVSDAMATVNFCAGQRARFDGPRIKHQIDRVKRVVDLLGRVRSVAVSFRSKAAEDDPIWHAHNISSARMQEIVEAAWHQLRSPIGVEVGPGSHQ